MTKIKNTKKGMAKKTLSMSLVVAMLATSNVPVWAAEFSDGSDDVAVATEAPAVETFSDEADAAPVVEDNADATAATETVSGDEYTATLTPIMFGTDEVKGNSVVWDTKNLTTTLTVKDNQKLAPGVTATIKAAWKVNGDVVTSSITSVTNGTLNCAYPVTSADANKKLALYVYAETTDGRVWSYTSDEITVNPKNTADVAKATVADVTYNGEIQKVIPTITTSEAGLTVTGTGATGAVTLADLEKVYSVGYDENSDFTNVTEKPITITLTPKSSAYTGSITATYKIIPKELSGSFTNEMVATLKNPSLKYDGTATGTVKVKKSDITLVDAKTKTVDLSDYLAADKDGYVNVWWDKDSAWISLINGTPENGTNKNYKITPTDESARRIKSTNVFEVANRDLSTVVATIKPVKATGNKIASVDITYKDKDTNEVLAIANDVDVTIPNDAVKVGKYTVTITAKAGKKVTGSTTAELSIYATNIAETTLKKGTVSTETVTGSGSSATYSINSSIKKYYTGEPVTFTTDEIGVPTTGTASAPLKDSDYEITYSNNTNAGTAKMFLIGKDSYENSIKEYTFTISKTPVSELTANDYVEKIANAKAEDYKTAMGLAVKAKVPGTNKVLTLEEGKDYTVKYEFANNNTQVKATVTLKANGNFDNANSINLVKTVDITKATLKAENIKLRETSFTYNGQAVEPAFDVVVGGHILPGPGSKDSNNKDISAYTYTYTNNVNAGTATLTVKGTGDYKGTASVTYTIQSADASKLTGAIPTQEYRGYSLEIPADKIDLTLDGKKIDVASNFNLTYGENKEVGEGTVTLTPKNNNFTGTKTLTFNICGEMLSTTTESTFKYVDKDGFEIKGNAKKFNYDGTAQTFAKTTLVNNTGKTLTAGTDYEIKYVDNVYGQKGTDSKQYAVVLAVAKGKFGGNLTKTSNGITVKDGVYTDAEGNKTVNVFAIDFIEINQQEITNSNISVSNGTYAAGLPVKPSVNIVVKGRTLVEGQDYDLDVSANKDVVNATEKKSLVVTIVPKNGYKKASGMTETYSWGIDKFDLANADVTVKDGKLSVKCGKVEVDTAEYTTTTNNDGTTTIAAAKTSKNYTGSKTIKTNGATEAEKPAAPMISNVKVVGNKATVILSGESEGAAGYDYVISTDRDCITNKDYDAVNKNQVKTESTFEYVGQGTYYAYCHAWKRDENGKKVFSDWSNAYPFVVSAITPSQPVITGVEVSGSTVTVTYTKAANATGYDVVLGTSTKNVNGETRPVEYGTLVKKNIKGNVVTATFKNVDFTNNKVYYAGLHAFNRTSEDGKKVFSKWSNVKPVSKSKK